MSYGGYHNLRALVVDDFESFRHTVVGMLENFGIESIETAASGAEAIRWCQDKRFDLILCDYNLGRGKNGQQVLEELRFRALLPPQTLFVLISAEASKAIVMSAYDYEPDAYLAKPITGNVLHQRLDRLLRQRDAMLPIFQSLEAGDVDVAATKLREQIVSGSRISTQCQKLLGELYFDNKRYREAEAVYQRALEIRELDWAKVGLAKVKLVTDQLHEAETWLREVLESNPLFMPAYDVLADLYQQTGDEQALLATLKEAVEYCPMAILRQQKLAQIAQQFHDRNSAAHAYRQTVRLGNNSCHDQLSNHINFGRTTAQLLKLDPEAAVDIARDAIKDMSELKNRFELSTEDRVQALLIESQVLVGQGNKRKAAELFAKAEALAAENKLEPSLTTEMDWVSALHRNGEVDKANQLLERLLTEYKDDQSALEQLDALLDEPVSKNNRRKVAEMNKTGIAHYDQEKYREAVTCFENARRLFPNHPGIMLNLVQSIEGVLRSQGYQAELVEQATGLLATVKERINPTHKEHPRFLQLRDMLAKQAKQ